MTITSLVTVKSAVLSSILFFSTGAQAQYVAVELLPYLKQSGLNQEIAEALELNPTQVAFEDAFLEADTGRPLQATLVIKTFYKQEAGMLTTLYRFDARCRITTFSLKYQRDEFQSSKRTETPKRNFTSRYSTEASQRKLQIKFEDAMQARIFQFIGENESLQEYCNPS